MRQRNRVTCSDRLIDKISPRRFMIDALISQDWKPRDEKNPKVWVIFGFTRYSILYGIDT